MSNLGSSSNSFDIAEFSTLVEVPAKGLESALEDLKNAAGGSSTTGTDASKSLSLSKATVETTNVNVAQAKLEMVQGVVKGALKIVDKQSKHLVQ